MNLYVSNLGERITDESLRAIFATHGHVNSTEIIKDDSTGHSRGFGFIDMPNEMEAQTAIQRIHGTVVDGCNISVRELKSNGKEILVNR